MSLIRLMEKQRDEKINWDEQIGRRINTILSSQGIKFKPFAEKIGIDPAHFRRLRKGNARWTANHLLAISKELNIPIWELFPSLDRENFLKSDEDISSLKKYANFYSEHAMIPLYKIDVAAGLDGIANGDYPEKEDDLPFKRYWLASKGYKGERIKKLILMRAKGESMEPTISSGEVLLVDIDESVRTPESIEKGRVYVVRWGITKDAISVKRLFLDLPREIAIAVSDNPLFKQVDVDLREYEKFQDFVLGKVIWVGKENI